MSSSLPSSAPCCSNDGDDDDDDDEEEGEEEAEVVVVVSDMAVVGTNALCVEGEGEEVEEARYTDVTDDPLATAVEPTALLPILLLLLLLVVTRDW